MKTDKYTIYDHNCRYFLESLENGKWNKNIEKEDVSKMLLDKDILAYSDRKPFFEELEYGLNNLDTFTVCEWWYGGFTIKKVK